MGASEISKRAFDITHGHTQVRAKNTYIWDRVIGNKNLLTKNDTYVYVCEKIDKNNVYKCTVTGKTYDLSVFGCAITANTVLLLEPKSNWHKLFRSNEIGDDYAVVPCGENTLNFHYSEHHNLLINESLDIAFKADVTDDEITCDADFILPKELMFIDLGSTIALSKDNLVAIAKAKVWKYASIVFPDSANKAYMLPNDSCVFLSDSAFNRLYEETGGGAIVLLYDSRYVGETDTTLEDDEYSYISLSGQYFNPKWTYDEKSKKYVMYGGDKIVSELYLPKRN